MATDRLNVTFDGVNDVARLEGQSIREFFGTPPNRTDMPHYSFYHSVEGNDLQAVANFTGSNWRINYWQMAGDDAMVTVRDLDNGADRRIDTMVLGFNSDVELTSTRVRYIFGWDGDKHSVTLGDEQQGSTGIIELYARVNEVTTGNAWVNAIVTGSTVEGGDVIRIGSGGTGSISTGDGNDRVFLSDGFVRAVSTRDGNDKIQTGSEYVRMVDAGEGNDTITMGTGGAGVVFGAGGNDKFIANAMPNPDWGTSFWGDSGTDLIDFKQIDQGVSFSLDNTAFQEIGGYNPNTDRVGYISASETENISGTRFADALTGNSANNKMVGRGGADRMEGKEGNDFLNGGGGRDVFVFGADAGTDRVKGYKRGQDTIEIADHSGGFRSLDITRAGKNLEIEHDGGTIVLIGRGGLELSGSDFDFV